MDFRLDHRGHETAIAELFRATFTASEGASEGELIGSLAADLMAQTPAKDLRVFTAMQDGRLVAAVVFSRLSFPQDARQVALLSPMAVATDQQSKGIGQSLLAFALGTLRTDGVGVVMTYGDPVFYSKAGFCQITEGQARAPLPLSMPFGWLGQCLTGPEFAPLQGPSFCVAPLNRPDVW